MPVVLDSALLDRFERALRGAGAVVVDHLAPGVDDAQIDALMRPLGIDLPDEARVWWRWHNGVLPDTPRLAQTIMPRRAICSLETVALGYENAKDDLLDSYGLVKMLEPFSDHPIIFVDCGGPRDEPVAIYSLSDWVADPRRVMASFGELIATWIGYIERGVHTTNPDGTWDFDHERVTQDMVKLGVY